MHSIIWAKKSQVRSKTVCIRKQKRKNGRVYLSVVQGYRAEDGKTRSKHARSLEEQVIVDSIYLCLNRIIEEASHLDFETMKKYPDVPWDAIRGLRNRIAHAYGDLDPSIMWGVLSNDLDALSEVSASLHNRKRVGNERRRPIGFGRTRSQHYAKAS